MSNSWSGEKDDSMRKEGAVTASLLEALRKLTADQVAELPTRELIALAIKARRG